MLGHGLTFSFPITSFQREPPILPWPSASHQSESGSRQLSGIESIRRNCFFHDPKRIRPGVPGIGCGRVHRRIRSFDSNGDDCHNGGTGPAWILSLPGSFPSDNGDKYTAWLSPYFDRTMSYHYIPCPIWLLNCFALPNDNRRSLRNPSLYG